MKKKIICIRKGRQLLAGDREVASNVWTYGEWRQDSTYDTSYYDIPVQ